MEAQSFSVKRAEVEFHNFASLGEPERAFARYADENVHRGALMRKHLDFIGPMTPFLEIGANAGHSSYMLVNEFGEQGFALDISADALRYGKALIERWHLARAPIRLAGDALRLPFADRSLRTVLAFQLLSQFQDIEAVFVEVKRVLQPGGLFLFADEPVRRLLSLRLYRAPYWEQMKPWERRLHKWGLLGYLTKDVIGAAQEEGYGIRQNHRMTLMDWDALVRKHFATHEYELFIQRRGWGEEVAFHLGKHIDRNRSHWVPARLLGGTIAAMCRKAGSAQENEGSPGPLETGFEKLLQCPDCRSAIILDEAGRICCGACGYSAPDEDGVYNLLPSSEKKELYPGPRADIIDFCRSDCSDRLVEGFHEIEGVFGNKYRWIGPRAVFRLERVKAGPLKLRIRGHASERLLHLGSRPRIEVKADGQVIGIHALERPGLFVIEIPLPHARPSYEVELNAAPAYQEPPDSRWFTVNLSMMRLVD